MADDNFASMVDNLIREAADLRERHEPIWLQNERRYLGDHWDRKPPKGLDQHTINRVLNTVIAHTAVQTEQRAKVKIAPQEVNEPAVIYLREGAFAKVEGLANPLPPSEMIGLEPIDDQTFAALMAITQPTIIEEPSQSPNATGQSQLQARTEDVPVLTPEDFYFINEQTIAEALQAIFDALWEKNDTDHFWTQNVLNKNIHGHQPQLVEWDDDRQCYRLVNVHPRNIWIAPESTGVHDAEYVIYDEWVSKRKALASLPQFAEIIEAQATRTPQSGAQSSRFSETENSTERDIVLLRHVWLRNSMFPMSPEDAIEQSLVQPAMEQAETIDAIGNPAIGEMPVVDDQGQPVFVNQEGQLTGPDNDNWPQESGILQALVIGEQTVERMRSPFVDIPFTWNINLPIPYQPYGIGTPENLEPLQQAVNRAFSYVMNTLKYNQSPEKAMPESVKKALQQEIGTIHSHPGRTLGVPDELWMMYGGKVLDTWEPPSIQTGVVQFLKILLEEIDIQGSRPAVLQGSAPGRVDSGVAIEALQSAARGSLGFSSLYTEHAIRAMTRLVLGMVIDFMSEAQWSKIVRKYPVHVLRTIRGMAKEVEMVISVEITSGRGAVKRQKQEQAIQLRQLQAISTQSLLEQMEIPNAAEEAIKAVQEMAAAQPVGAGR